VRTRQARRALVERMGVTRHGPQHRGVIAGSIALALVALFAWAVAPSSAEEALSSATCQIRILSGANNEAPLDETELNTHVVLITSRAVLERAIKGEITEGVWACDQCNREYAEGEIENLDSLNCIAHGCGGRIRRVNTKKYPEWVPLNEKWAAFDSKPKAYDIEQVAVMLKGRLRVERVPGTRLINITYTSADPIEVAAVANVVAEAYIQRQRELARDRLRETAVALVDLTENLRRTGVGSSPNGLEQLERELDEFRLKHKLIFTSEGTPAPVDLNELRREVIRLEVQIASRSARLKQLEALDKAALIDALQGDQSLYDYKRMKAEQEIALNAALVDFGKDHPSVQRLNESIAELQAKIEKQADGIVNALRIELASLTKEKTALDQRMESLERSVFEKELALTEYKRMADEVDRLNAVIAQLADSKMKAAMRLALLDERIEISERAH